MYQHEYGMELKKVEKNKKVYIQGKFPWVEFKGMKKVIMNRKAKIIRE